MTPVEIILRRGEKGYRKMIERVNLTKIYCKQFSGWE
jgi:hypothetical protein